MKQYWTKVTACIALYVATLGIVQWQTVSQTSDEIRIYRRNTIASAIYNLQYDMNLIESLIIYQLKVQGNEVSARGLILSERDFQAIALFNDHPYNDAIQNIRFTPLVYDEDLESFQNRSREIITANYTIKNIDYDPIRGSTIVPVTESERREYYLPIHYSTPRTFEDDAFGIDLLSLPFTRDYFTRFTAISNNVSVSEGFQLVTSEDHLYDRGIYFGLIVTDGDCQTTVANNFHDLVIANKDSRCILGFYYISIRVQEYISRIQRDFSSGLYGEAFETAKFIVLENDSNEIIYRDPELSQYLTGDEFLQYAETNTDLIDSFTDSSNSLHVFVVFDEKATTNRDLELKVVQEHIIFSAMILVGGLICGLIAYLFNKTFELKNRQLTDIKTMVAYINHEIRNPLNIMMSYIQITITRIEKFLVKLVGKKEGFAEMDDLFDQVETFMDAIKSDLDTSLQSSRLLSIIVNDMLDVQRMEENQLAVCPQVFNLRHFGKTLYKIMQPKIDERKARIDFRVEVFDKNLKIFIDPRRLEQILVNYITNSYKHTEEGHITVAVTKEMRNAQSWITFSVEDTGFGIADEIRATIFRKKFIGPNESPEGIRGAGIGLYLCRLLSDKLGGEVDFISERKKGSTFYFRMPENALRIPDLELKRLNSVNSDSSSDLEYLKEVSLDENDEVVIDVDADSPKMESAQ